MRDRDQCCDDRRSDDAETEGAQGALLEQFGADEIVHGWCLSLEVSEKKMSSRFDSSSRIS